MEQRLKFIFRAFWILIFAFLFSLFCFSLLFFSKISAAFSFSAQNLSPAFREQIEANLGLDAPFFSQYFSWLSKLLKGDFGTSLINGQNVSSLLIEALPNTLKLTLLAFFTLLFLSLILGTLCVFFKNSIFSKIIDFFALSFFSLPSFAICLILILFFSVFLQILPSSGEASFDENSSFFDEISYLVLPVFALILSHLAAFLKITRTTLEEILNQAYIQAAFARGLSLKRIYFHLALKGSLGAILSYFGANFVGFVMNVYIIEAVFSFGGLGNLLIKSVLFKDFPVLLATLIFSVLTAIFINFLASFFGQILHPKKAND